MNSFKKICQLACALSMLSVGITPAQAALVETALPDNAFITMNGFDWAWGANCSSVEFNACDTIDLSFQSGFGWRIAEASDMDLAPVALDFLFAGANVAFNGFDPVSGASFDFLNDAYADAASAGACASAYFTLGDGSNACDWFNGGGQDTNTVGWFNQNGENRFFSDVLFVRETTVVPVPAAVWLLGSGLLGLVGLRRRNKA
ncbi:MAG: VPLPA-CTERM sorting domain-containing protein [Gammaproteobacteria bacterium]